MQFHNLYTFLYTKNLHIYNESLLTTKVRKEELK
jgi:hypothetical protein